MQKNVLLASPFISTEQRLFFSNMRLYPDQISFRGFSWTGRYQRTVLLTEIAEVTWQSSLNREPNLSIRLHDGEEFLVWVKSAGLWKFKIDEHAPNLTPPVNPSTTAIAPAA